MARPPLKTYRIINPENGETMGLMYGDVIEESRPHFEARGFEVIDANERRNGEAATDRATGEATR